MSIYLDPESGLLVRVTTDVRYIERHTSTGDIVKVPIELTRTTDCGQQAFADPPSDDESPLFVRVMTRTGRSPLLILQGDVP